MPEFDYSKYGIDIEERERVNRKERAARQLVEAVQAEINAELEVDDHDKDVKRLEAMSLKARAEQAREDAGLTRLEAEEMLLNMVRAELSAKVHEHLSIELEIRDLKRRGLPNAHLKRDLQRREAMIVALENFLRTITPEVTEEDIERMESEAAAMSPIPDPGPPRIQLGHERPPTT